MDAEDRLAMRVRSRWFAALAAPRARIFVAGVLAVAAGALASAAAVAVPVPIAEPPGTAIAAAAVLNLAAAGLRVLTLNRIGPAMQRGAGLPPPNPDLSIEYGAGSMLMLVGYYESVERAHARYWTRTMAPAIGAAVFGVALTFCGDLFLLGGVEAANADLLRVAGMTVSGAALGCWAFLDWRAAV